MRWLGLLSLLSLLGLAGASRFTPPTLDLEEEDDSTALAKPLEIGEDDDPKEEEDESFPYPALCTESIVQESCELLANSRGTVTGVDKVSFQELQDAIVTTFDSMVNYMEEIGLPDYRNFRVPCMQLCQLTVLSLPTTHVPPQIDTACYRSDTSIHCDIDVSDETFRQVNFSIAADAPEVQLFRSRSGRQLEAEEVAKDGWAPNEAPIDEEDVGPSRPEELGIEQMRISVANLFRIYPPFELEVTEAGDTEKAAVAAEEAGSAPSGSGSFMQDSQVDEEQIDDKDCHTAVPGAVKRSSSWWRTLLKSTKVCKCPRGSILKGERYCRSSKYAEDRRKFNPQQLQGKCRCVPESRSKEVIPPSCRDKSPTGFRSRYYGQLSCKAMKKRCNEHKVYDICPETCKSTCSMFAKDDAPEEKKKWEIDVARRAVEAQAYTAKALRALGARSASREMRTWFGDSDHWTREKVKTILNGVHRLLSNVDYRYPNKGCHANTFAYVRPYSPMNKNRRGRYIFYLCKLYMKSDRSTQIETLTHEASHHETMYTEDMCEDGTEDHDCNVAYGRGACKRLARYHPDAALKNADNYCFFINDVAAKH